MDTLIIIDTLIIWVLSRKNAYLTCCISAFDQWSTPATKQHQGACCLFVKILSQSVMMPQLAAPVAARVSRYQQHILQNNDSVRKLAPLCSSSGVSGEMRTQPTNKAVIDNISPKTYLQVLFSTLTTSVLSVPLADTRED